MLVAQRLGMEVQGISFPGHFLCRIFEDGEPIIVDCFDGGQVHPQRILTDSANDLGDEQRRLLEGSADPGTILMRILNNLIDALSRTGQQEDVDLLKEMRDSMALQKAH